MRPGNLLSTIFALVPSALILLHLLVAPFTSTEESFHIQATHDILIHGFPAAQSDPKSSNYDHLAFPRDVPRTCVGALVLAKLSRSIVALSTGVNPLFHEAGGLNSTSHEHLVVPRAAAGTKALTELFQHVVVLSEGIDQQVLARTILGLYNAFALALFARGIRRSFGQTVATWYLAFQASQFHLIYNASRPLSNMFAFGLTTLAMRDALPDAMLVDQRHGRGRVCILLLTMAGAIFDSEIALLAAIQTLFLLYLRQIRPFQDAIFAGLLGLWSGIFLTVFIDTLFWMHPVWPELNAFLFNVVSGQSYAWDIEPWYFYFFNALPRLLLNPFTYLVAIPVALRQPATRKPAISLLIPSLSFITLYSFVSHKEWRFIIYTVPPLTAAASLGATYLWTHRSRSFVARTASLLLVASTIATFLLSNLMLLPASAANYPGAHAMNALSCYHAQTAATGKIVDSQSSDGVSVYLDNIACQTGVTRFLQQPATWEWHCENTEDNTAKSTGLFWDRFDYVLVEVHTGQEYKNSSEARLWYALPGSQWETVEVIGGFTGFPVLRPGSPVNGSVGRRLLSSLGGEHAVGLFEHVRNSVGRILLRDWWFELKMHPKIKVLKRVRGG